MRLLVPYLPQTVYADQDRQEQTVRDSGLEWVIVRPSLLKDALGRGSYRVLTDLADFHGSHIAQKDIADFVIKQITTLAYRGRTPLVAW